METKYHEQFIKFGLKVQYYRKLRGMTQETFAEAIGKSWSFVARIKPDICSALFGSVIPQLSLR